MEMDYNLKKLANFFNFISCIFKKMLKLIMIYLLLGEIILYFPSGALIVISNQRRVLCQIFEQFCSIHSRIFVTVPL